MMKWIHIMHDFSGMTSFIHEFLSDLFPELATTIIEYVIIGLVTIMFVAFLGLLLVY